LLIDADLALSGLSRNLDLTQTPGWRDVLQGQTADPVVLTDNLSVLPAGQDPRQTDTCTGIVAIRKALARISDGQDLVLICAPGPGTSAMAELLLSASDLGLAEVRPNHRKAAVAAHILRLDTLPRQGGGVVFTHAQAGDPGLPA
jgi:MinD-like ATPase involved in chromosome partitioning or flagellar assembly